MTTLKPIEIGFSNNIFDNPRDIIACIDDISKAFKVIEIEIAEEAQEVILESSQAEYQDLIAGLVDLKEEKDLDYHVHAAWFGPGTDVLAVEDKKRTHSHDLLRRSIKFAHDLGADLVTFHPGKSHKRTGMDLVEPLLESIHDIAVETKASGIDLCLEIMGAQRPLHAVLYPDELIYICENAPVSICLDIPHLASLDPIKENILASVKKLAPYTKQVHIADTVLPDHRHIPIGQGNAPLLEILLTLEETGYEYDAIVEEFNKGFEPQEYWDAAVKFRESYLAHSSRN